MCTGSLQVQIQHVMQKVSNYLQTLRVGELVVFWEEETLHLNDTVSLEKVIIGEIRQGTEHTVQIGVVDTAGVVVKFSNAEMSFVGRRVLGESTAGLAHLPTLCIDPGTTRGGCHSGGDGRWKEPKGCV